VFLLRGRGGGEGVAVDEPWMIACFHQLGQTVRVDRSSPKQATTLGPGVLLDDEEIEDSLGQPRWEESCLTRS